MRFSRLQRCVGLRRGIVIPAIATAFPVFASMAMAESHAGATEQGSSAVVTLSSPQGVTAPACKISGDDEFTISCNYATNPSSKSDAPPDQRVSDIALDRFDVSFKVRGENEIKWTLTFRNTGTVPYADSRTVYVAIDDDAGHNYLRRFLPQIDFRKIGPGESATFSGKLLSAGLRPGHYAFELWIPNPDSALKFNPSYNMLLRNKGVSDLSTGLNILARFTVEQ